MRAAAGIAGDADALGIHLRAAHQIIKRPDAIPNRVAGKALARHQRLHAEHRMFTRRRRQPRSAHIGIEKLNALALSGRVPGQRHKSFGRETSQHILPRFVGLRARLMAQREEDRRIGSRPLLRNVQISGDVELRLAFENHLLNPEILSFNHPNGSGIQRRPFRQPANIGEYLLPELAAPRLHRGQIIQLRAIRQMLLRLIPEPCRKLLRQVAQFPNTLREIQLLRRLGSQRAEEH